MATGEYVSIFTGEEIDARLAQVPTIVATLLTKQDIINDLDTIRSGAAAGASAYQKPNAGIPKADMASGVQTSLDKADSAYQKPSGGIQKSDLASGVQASLDKADSAIQDVSDKADKDTAAVKYNLAKFDGDGNPVDSGISERDLVKKESSVPSLVSGFSKGVIDPNAVGAREELLSRLSKKDRIAHITKFEGKTLAWNQLGHEVSNSYYYLGSASGYVTNWTAMVQGGGVYGNNNTIVPAGHKILVSAIIRLGNAGDFVQVAYDNSAARAQATTDWQVVSFLATGVGTAGPFNIRNFEAANWGSVEVLAIQYFDLTLAGIADEISTPDDFLALYHGIYPYNPGTLKSNDADAVEITGKNIWDEEWELGMYNPTTGEKEGAVDTIRCKNFIPIFPNTQYYLKGAGISGIYAVFYYDAYKNFISSVTAVPDTITTPGNAYYMTFRNYIAYGTTYNHDICINISNQAINGQYFPYKKSRINLGLKNIKVVSPNVWDEEWEAGKGINPATGEIINDPTCCTSKNFIPVFGGLTYYSQNGSWANRRIGCYDADKNFISFVYDSGNGAFTTPSNCAYLLFFWNGTTYNHDITINKSDPAFNGRYFPSGILTLTGGVKGDDYIQDGKTYHKRCERVSLWDKTYEALGSGRFLLAESSLTNIVHSLYRKMVCSGYTFSDALISSDIPNMGIANNEWISGAYDIIIKNTAYSDSNSFKGDLQTNNVYLDYELQYEEVYDLVDDLPCAYEEIEGGVVSVIGRSPRMPLVACFSYSNTPKQNALAIADIQGKSIAEGIADTISAGTPQEFAFRQSGGDGVNYMKMIKGKTVAWNQLVRNGNFADGTTGYTGVNGTISASNNTLTYAVTSVGSTLYSNITSTHVQNINKEHKYYFALDIKPAHTKVVECFLIGISGNPEITLSPTATAGQWNHITAVQIPSGTKSFSASTELQIALNCTSLTGYSVGDVDYIRNFMIVDLTLLYGSALDGKTDAEILAMYEADFGTGHYPYNAGKNISNDAEAVEATGKNQWDEEWELGTIDSLGQNASSETTIRAKNLIPVSPNTEYYNRRADITQGHYFYDANGDFIRRDGVNTYTFTTPQNAAYMRFVQSGTSYNSETCINISNAAFNGQYEPYWKRKIGVGLNSFQVMNPKTGEVLTVNGLKSAGSVFDEIKDGKYIKRVGRVDLGSLEWEIMPYSTGGHAFMNKETTDIPAGGWIEYDSAPCICSKYAASPQAGESYMGDKTIAVDRWTGGHGCINIIDSDYSNADAASIAAFTASLAGVMLDYELATPEEYDLVTPIPNAIMVDALGTERAVFPVHSDGTPSAPFACDSNYSISVKNLVAILNSLNS